LIAEAFQEIGREKKASPVARRCLARIRPRRELKFNEVLDRASAETKNNYRIGSNVATTATLGRDGRTITLTYAGIAGGLASATTLDIVQGPTNPLKDINENLALFPNPTQAISANGETVGPLVMELIAVSATELDVVFSEVMDKTTAETPANYRLASATVSKAALQDDGYTVRLTTDLDPLWRPLTIFNEGGVTDINGQNQPGVEDFEESAPWTRGTP